MKIKKQQTKLPLFINKHKIMINSTLNKHYKNIQKIDSISDIDKKDGSDSKEDKLISSQTPTNLTDNITSLIGFVFIIIKYNRTLTKMNNDILLAGFDFNIDEQILWKKITSPLYLRRDDKGFILNFIFDYLNKYEEITDMDLSQINPNIILLEVELLDVRAAEMWYANNTNSILNPYSTKLLSLALLDPEFKGSLTYSGRILTPKPGILLDSMAGSLNISLFKEQVLPIKDFISNNNSKDYLANIIKSTTNRDLTYKPDQITNDLNFADYV